MAVLIPDSLPAIEERVLRYLGAADRRFTAFETIVVSPELADDPPRAVRSALSSLRRDDLVVRNHGPRGGRWVHQRPRRGTAAPTGHGAGQGAEGRVMTLDVERAAYEIVRCRNCGHHYCRAAEGRQTLPCMNCGSHPMVTSPLFAEKAGNRAEPCVTGLPRDADVAVLRRSFEEAVDLLSVVRSDCHDRLTDQAIQKALYHLDGASQRLGVLEANVAKAVAR